MPLLFFSLLLFLTAPASAQTPEQLGQVLERYAAATGGWYLEQACEHLPENKRARYEQDVHVIRSKMQSVLGIKKPMLDELDSAGRKVAAKHAEQCGEDTETIVTDTQRMAKSLRQLLEKLESEW